LSSVQSRLDAACEARGISEPIQYVAVANSSNILVRALAERGAPHGTTVMVGEQRAGKGRQGRSWDLAPGDGLAMSVLLRPDRPGARYPMLALGAAVAVASALGDKFLIKWPNDILSPAGKKVSGILSEADISEGFLIIGIGINCNRTPLGVERACAASDVTGEAIDQAALAAEVVSRVLEIANWSESAVLTAWRERDALIGQSIRVGKVSGVAAGVDERGALRVESIDGAEAYVLAGDVELIGQLGRD
jgi:BirA family biotin operon repressor/biotin-[acetyl-CoA-carboxylase] ligase